MAGGGKIFENPLTMELPKFGHFWKSVQLKNWFYIENNAFLQSINKVVGGLFEEKIH